MNEIQLDPRATKLQTYAKVGGGAVVVAAVSTIVAAAATSLVVAAGMAVVGLLMVNYVVPVAARSFALWRVKTITALTEAFSEETIREDEVNEAKRIQTLEQQYTESRAELEGAIEELKKQMDEATTDEKELLKTQIVAMKAVITSAEDTLKTRKEDFKELQRVNKLYISFHRAGSAMSKAKGAERNADQMQQVETARTAIKTKMREAMAGKTIEAMNAQTRNKTRLVEVASL
jgi:hypothetical protein